MSPNKAQESKMNDSLDSYQTFKNTDCVLASPLLIAVQVLGNAVWSVYR